MFEWISHNRELFLVNYTEVGSSHQNACALQEEHSHFTQNSMVSETPPPLLLYAVAQRHSSTYPYRLTPSNIGGRG